MQPGLRNTLVALLLVAASASHPAAGEGAAPQDIQVLVDTSALTLTVLQGNEVKFSFSDISIGRFGATANKRRGDNMTPLGEFRIAWIKEDSRFHGFLGLDYPDLARAERALDEGAIEQRDWRRIRDAHARQKLPPQTSPLGGQIGIHGIGDGDPSVHAKFNWTNGCIALSNEQMDRLLPWVIIGTPVQIR
jgi:murein L,D-transpeptidase YafK